MDTSGKAQQGETWRRTAERQRKELGFSSWSRVGAAARDRAE